MARSKKVTKYGLENPARLAVIVVNYRTAELVQDCLASLETEIDPDQDVVVVVDNASRDGSADRLRSIIAREEWNGWAHLIEAERNLGFSAGNNIGIRAVSAKYYFLLNSDTIVRPGAIHALLEAYQTHPGAGLIAPRLENRDGTPQMSALQFPSPISEFIRGAGTGPITRLLRRYSIHLEPPETPTLVEWACFAAILIRAEVIETVGPMDEGYFMYFEDVDYCRSAERMGWDLWYWPAAHVIHLQGGTSPVSKLSEQKKKRPRYYYQARARYFWKFYGGAGYLLANSMLLAGLPIAYLRQLIKPRQLDVCKGEVFDIWTGGFRAEHYGPINSAQEISP